MSDDKNISALISKSLRQRLDQHEESELEDHLKDNTESRNFAELSKMIQDSVRGLRVEVEETSNVQMDATKNMPAFSPDIQERLKQSVNSAVEEKLSLSQAGLINAKKFDPELTRSEDGGIVDTSTLHVGNTESDNRELVTGFKLIRKLGQGGLGTVWLARDKKLNRNVAIKELKVDSLESSTAWDRFHREAEITGNLEHPNIVPLYLYGVDRKSGQPFYAMRFVGKKNLSVAIEEYHDKVQAGQTDALSLHRLITVFLDICQAIAYAHSRGVIHRDLKPQNVALDNFGQVIVLDWGLAKVVEDSELAMKMTRGSQLTESVLGRTIDGEVIGTPLFMSPEQASGDIDKIDTRTDIYGLGAILFTILVGSAPHQKNAKTAENNVSKFIHAVASAEPPSAADYGKTIPRELEEICQKAMARKPHLRFETVEQLAEAVESWAAGQSNKSSAFEKLRMEGRELRSEMYGRTRDLERNVRFSASLPPIDGIIRAESDDDVKVWRKRLSQIFEGMLNANPDYRSVLFCKLQDDEQSEIVRVERLQRDGTGVRIVPKTRLRTSKLNEYLEKVSELMPGEVLTAMICDEVCELSTKDCSSVGLISGVPVYDSETEEIFGFVLIVCDVEKMLNQALSRCLTAGEVIIACDVHHVVGHCVSGRLVEDTKSKPIKEVAPHFLPAIKDLREQLDYEDVDSGIYGGRLWFIPNKHGIMYLLKRSS